MPPSPHDYAKKLIEIAESDFKAAEVLLNSGMYPQAVFLIQQALEKAVKAIALELNLITPKVAEKKLSHYIVERLIDYIMNNVRSWYIVLLKMCCEGNEKSCKAVSELESSVSYWLELSLPLGEVIETLEKLSNRKCNIEKKCNIKIPAPKGNVPNNSSEQLKKLEELGYLILVTSNLSLFKCVLSESMKCHTKSVCRFLKLSGKERDELIENLSELSSYVSSWANIVSEVYEALGTVLKGPPEDIEDVAYRYTLSDMLSFLLMYYVLYEPFVTYARYPNDECSPLDVKDGTYIVELSKWLTSKCEFKEAFRCVKEFIERKTETERCRNILRATRQILSAIREAYSNTSL